MIVLLFLVSILYPIESTYVISVYGDVYKDTKFFTTTYPWIIDNIGGDITVDYYLLGSGRYSVPQMCALYELRLNTFLQADFLKCEAEGRPSNDCLCQTGINPQRFKQCVQSKGSLASFASSKYTQLAIEASPIIEIGPRNTIFEVEDTWYLKKICTIFGDDLPRGCVKPFACNGTEDMSGRGGISHFNCDCFSQCDKTPGMETTTAYPTTTHFTEFEPWNSFKRID